MLIARRNLLRDRTRFLLSVLGVAVSAALILLLAGYRDGVYRQASAYLDNTPGTIVVAEKGIRDFLGTSSVLPDGVLPAVRSTPGVGRVIPVVSSFVIFERHDRKDCHEAKRAPWRQSGFSSEPRPTRRPRGVVRRIGPVAP
ncbi:MAG: ABC transporter permease, partial [Candidatus Limnocylindrales bacterium]